MTYLCMHLFDACVHQRIHARQKGPTLCQKRCMHTSLLTQSRSLLEAKATYYVSKAMHACIKSGGRLHPASILHAVLARGQRPRAGSATLTLPSACCWFS
jgi:hypothetical protein